MLLPFRSDKTINQFGSTIIENRGMEWCIWKTQWTTNQKIMGSIPDGGIIIFYWHNPFSRIMTPGSTQPLAEMSTRNISWGVKVASA